MSVMKIKQGKESPNRFDVEGLIYVFDKAPLPAGGKVVVKVADSSEQVRAFGRVNLYATKEQERFVHYVARRCSRSVEEVYGHLAVALDTVERSHLAQAQPQTEEVTADRKAQALSLLHESDLLSRAVEAMGADYVGEERNKALVYLVATSRLLAQPLSALVMASSGSGKSGLLDALTRIMPPEEVREITRVSRTALYYADSDYLRHKLVVVDEQQGSRDADHAIRVMQSKGMLNQAVTVGGQLQSQVVHGPIALLSGTTSTDLNPENLSRCLELSLDDSPEQTRRIHAAERRAWAGESPAPEDTTPLLDAQRLLDPLAVMIPFAERLTFPARTTHDRRNQLKLLSLVAAHALLYQHQRDRDSQGRLVATVEDYATVHDLLSPVLARRLEGLSERACKALEVLDKSASPVTRREVASELGWAFNTAKAALAELVAQELASVARTGRPQGFQVLDRSPLGGRVPLTPPESLAR